MPMPRLLLCHPLCETALPLSNRTRDRRWCEVPLLPEDCDFCIHSAWFFIRHDRKSKMCGFFGFFFWVGFVFGGRGGRGGRAVAAGRWPAGGALGPRKRRGRRGNRGRARRLLARPGRGIPSPGVPPFSGGPSLPITTPRACARVCLAKCWEAANKYTYKARTSLPAGCPRGERESLEAFGGHPGVSL